MILGTIFTFVLFIATLVFPDLSRDAHVISASIMAAALSISYSIEKKNKKSS